MKRTTLRTSAIALGIAAALPATAQEWNLGWGGFIHQHVAFGNNEVKVKPVEVKNLHFKIKGDHDGKRTTSGKFEMTVKFIGRDGVPADAPSTAFTTSQLVRGTGEDANILYVNPVTANFDIDTSNNVPDIGTGLATIYSALVAPITDDAPQIKTIYIKSRTVNNNVVSQLNFADLAIFLNVMESTYIDLPTTASDRQKLNDIEIVIVQPDALTPTQVTNADVAKTDITNNAYDQAVAAAAAFNAKAVNKAVKRSGSAQHSNVEVHFKPSVTLDSGWTFGALIEFEGDGAGIDESSLSISSESVGTLKLGKHGAPLMMVGAPSVGLGINSGDHPNFIPVDHGSGAVYSTAAPTGGAPGKQQRISYQTPANMLGGLQAGIAYAAGNTDGRNSGFLKTAESDGDLSDIIDLGVKFAQPFGESNVALSMRYSTAKQEGAGQNPREFGVGAEFGFGGFTIGGAYADTEREGMDGKDLSSNGWNLGISYAMEAWTFGIETYQGEYDNGDDHSVSKIAASRKLADGVNWDFYALTASSKKTVTGTKVPGAQAITANAFRAALPGETLVDSTARVTEKSGTVFGTAIKLKF